MTNLQRKVGSVVDVLISVRDGRSNAPPDNMKSRSTFNLDMFSCTLMRQPRSKGTRPSFFLFQMMQWSVRLGPWVQARSRPFC